MNTNKIPTFEEMLKIVPIELLVCLEDCSNTPQSPQWHPEGDVLKHIKIVYTRALTTQDLNLVISALFHDLGKVEKTKPNKNGGWGAHGHEDASARMVERSKDWITSIGGDWKQVYEIVKQHMRVKLMKEMRKPKREALEKNPWFDKLIKFTELDNMQNLTEKEKNI